MIVASLENSEGPARPRCGPPKSMVRIFLRSLNFYKRWEFRTSTFPFPNQTVATGTTYLAIGSLSFLAASPYSRRFRLYLSLSLQHLREEPQMVCFPFFFFLFFPFSFCSLLGVRNHRRRTSFLQLFFFWHFKSTHPELGILRNIHV